MGVKRRIERSEEVTDGEWRWEWNKEMIGWRELDKKKIVILMLCLSASFRVLFRKERFQSGNPRI